MSHGQRTASAIGVLASLTLFVFIAFIAPDDGPDIDGVLLGLGLGAIVAAPPMAVMASRGEDPLIVALSGGMVIAGVATTGGGNWTGLVVALVGLLLLAGATPAPRPSWGIVGLMLGYAAVLVLGQIAAFSAGIGTLFAVMIGVIVAMSPRWLPTSATTHGARTSPRKTVPPPPRRG